jgi:2-polyprenyl-3-methyl-5-hydroxy-6-metoxy-1,4-benzoquinol methylase
MSLEKIRRSGVAMVTKVDHVQTYFEQPEQYLSRRSFEILVRSETVREWAGNSGDMQVLDIGCGDGSISLPLLREATRITLLDLSSSMLSIAKAKVPLELAENVETVNQDFSTAQFKPRSFDLIICVGVLAHVNSPAEFIAKIVSLLKPGGRIIIECTDSRHMLTRMFLLFRKVCAVWKPTTYALNAVSSADITKILGRYQMYQKAKFRYVAPFPGCHKLLSQDSLYKLTRQVFKRPGTNQNGWLGNAYLGLFTV